MSVGANKAALRAYCEAYRNSAEDGFALAAERFYANDAQINIVHPFNEVAGADGYRKQFLGPLLSAFIHLRRSDSPRLAHLLASRVSQAFRCLSSRPFPNGLVARSLAARPAISPTSPMWTTSVPAAGHP